MSRFPSVGHLISWAGFCLRLTRAPANGARRGLGRHRHWLEPTLINAAWAAIRKKDCTCAPIPRHQKPPRREEAILAVASSMLTAAYFMLRDGVEYHDLGSQHFEQRDKDQLAKRLLQRLRDLGVAVEVKAA